MRAVQGYKRAIEIRALAGAGESAVSAVSFVLNFRMGAGTPRIFLFSADLPA
jgi:hypothetical protein